MRVLEEDQNFYRIFCSLTAKEKEEVKQLAKSMPSQSKSLESTQDAEKVPDTIAEHVDTTTNVELSENVVPPCLPAIVTEVLPEASGSSKMMTKQLPDVNATGKSSKQPKKRSANKKSAIPVDRSKRTRKQK